MNHSFGYDAGQAFAWWSDRLSSYRSTCDQLKRAFTPDEHLFSKEFASSYVDQRTDQSYSRDMSLLTPHLVQRDVDFNCYPLMLYILEHGFATFPECLDEAGRPELHSSVCLSIINPGGPHIAYLFKRSEHELNSLIFGGAYGMLLAKCSITPQGATVQWFGNESQGPRSLSTQHDAVEKLVNHLFQCRGRLIEYVGSCQYSSLPPLCLCGHYASLGHYIWNELPLIGLLEHFPSPLHIAIGEHDFADIYQSSNRSPKVVLTRVEMNGISHALNEDHVYTSSRPLIILKDVFAIGKSFIKKAVTKHLENISCSDGILSEYIDISRHSLVVSIGLRITGRRRFNSISELMQILDSIFTDRDLSVKYYLDGYTALPARPSKTITPFPSEQIAVQELMLSLPKDISDKCLPYVVPALADKWQLFNHAFCGFYPIGSGSSIPGWITDMPTFYFDDGRFYNQNIDQDFICNSLKTQNYAINPNLFKDNEDGSFSIASHDGLREYLDMHISELAKTQ